MSKSIRTPCRAVSFLSLEVFKCSKKDISVGRRSGQIKVLFALRFFNSQPSSPSSVLTHYEYEDKCEHDAKPSD